MSRWATAIARWWRLWVCMTLALLLSDLIVMYAELPEWTDWVLGVGLGCLAGAIACVWTPKEDDKECTVTTPTES
jgi:hypothetical protein